MKNIIGEQSPQAVNGGVVMNATTEKMLVVCHHLCANHLVLIFISFYMVILPTTNSSHLKMVVSNKKLLFQGSNIFRGFNSLLGPRESMFPPEANKPPSSAPSQPRPLWPKGQNPGSWASQSHLSINRPQKTPNPTGLQT